MEPGDAIELMEQMGRLNVARLEDSKLSSAEQARIRKGALQVLDDQSSLWADTILEGDMELTGDMQIDEIEVLSLDDEIFGYKVSVSAEAVGTWGDEPVEGSVTAAGFLTRSLTAERVIDWIAEFND